MIRKYYMTIDISNKKIGKLTVKHKLDKYHTYQSKRPKVPYYLCLCDCGKTIEVRKDRLLREHTKSCGCLRAEHCIKNGKSVKLSPGEKPRNNLYCSYKRSAKNRKLTFNISREEFKSLIELNCYYCNLIPSNQFKHPRDKLDILLYSGIDRIDSSLGYVKGNVVPCCSFCNYAKSNYTKQEFIDNIKRLYAFLHEKCRL